MPAEAPKLPVSVLVVIHTSGGEVLLLERAARPGFWQSVTGSLDRLDEPPAEAATREVLEETGIRAAAARAWNLAYTFEIYARWRHRFADGVTHNTEHVFGFTVSEAAAAVLDPAEHTAQIWLPWQQAMEKTFSPTNRDAIWQLSQRRRP